VQGIVSEYERAKIMERSRRGKKHAAQHGWLNVMSNTPFGYRYITVHDGGGEARFERIPKQAATEPLRECRDEVLGVNLNGVFQCPQAVIRPMALRRSGVIINISSLAGEHPLHANANYNSAKAAVNALTRSSAVELARFGIRVNAVSPGFIEAQTYRRSRSPYARRLRFLASNVLYA
jgi:NAD(P)-dependent dehydrogenase (short-subunit alcohol dehydrogenase family)